MPILRTDVNEYSKVKKAPRTERKFDDYDLAWKNIRVYVLDEHEWYDPHTSTKYDSDGMSRHAMLGPAGIVNDDVGGSSNTLEYHVNDPKLWAFVRRSILKGYLHPSNMPDDEIAKSEHDVEVTV